MKTTEALNEEQQVFAALHHNLIYEYLYHNKLSENDYYDIVVFGYLRACKRYLEQEELRQYSFTTIAWKAMDSSVNSEYRKKSAQKRSAVLLSLDADMELFLSSTDLDYMEIEDIWHSLKEHTTDKQMQAFMLQQKGYKASEIGDICGGIKASSVYGRLFRFRKNARQKMPAVYS